MTAELLLLAASIAALQINIKTKMFHQKKYLIWSTEEVGIILLESSHPGQSSQCTRQFITMENSKVSHP